MRFITALLLWPTLAFSTPMVMTFDEASGTTATWTEGLITATANSGFISDGFAHLDRTYSIFQPRWIDFTTGSAFTADSLMFDPVRSGHCTPTDCTEDAPIEYIWFSSYLAGSLTGSIGLYSPGSNGFQSISLGSLGVMDMLRVEIRNVQDLGYPGDDLYYFGGGHYTIDNVTLAPVPEPSLVLLLLAGLGGAFAMRRKFSAATTTATPSDTAP